jgi:hypothetical protein
MPTITVICSWCGKQIRKRENPRAMEDMTSYGIHSYYKVALEARANLPGQCTALNPQSGVPPTQRRCVLDAGHPDQHIDAMRNKF